VRFAASQIWHYSLSELRYMSKKQIQSTFRELQPADFGSFRKIGDRASPTEAPRRIECVITGTIYFTDDESAHD